MPIIDNINQLASRFKLAGTDSFDLIGHNERKRQR
jgi:hypothetical protein